MKLPPSISYFLKTRPLFLITMTISEDESLLNSSSDEENIVKSPFSDNSVTAIISDESSENEEENEEENEDDK